MEVVAILVGVCQIITMLGLALLFKMWADAKQRQIEKRIDASLRGFIESADEKTPSPLAVIVDQFAVVFAGRLVQQLTAGLRSSVGGQNKHENEAMADLSEAALTSGNPWLGLVANILPKKLKRTLLANPQMAQALATRLNGGNHSSADDDFSNRIGKGD